MPLILDEDEEEEEELEDNPFRGQDGNIGGDDAIGEDDMDDDEEGPIGEDDMDAEGEQDLWSEEGGGQDIEITENTWQGPQIGGALLVCHHHPLRCY
jgi:hypothetical protein